MYICIYNLYCIPGAHAAGLHDRAAAAAGDGSPAGPAPPGVRPWQGLACTLCCCCAADHRCAVPALVSLSSSCTLWGLLLVACDTGKAPPPPPGWAADIRCAPMKAARTNNDQCCTRARGATAEAWRSRPAWALRSGAVLQSTVLQSTVLQSTVAVKVRVTASGEVVAECELGPMETVTALAAWPTLTTPFARPSTTFCALDRPHNQSALGSASRYWWPPPRAPRATCPRAQTGVQLRPRLWQKRRRGVLKPNSHCLCQLLLDRASPDGMWRS